MADVGFGTVRGRYLTAEADTNDPEVAPDLVPLEGSVLFTSTASVLRVVGADPDPATVILTRGVRVALDAEGYLAVDGSRDVTLLATDSAAGNPVDWQWHVEFALTRDGVPVYHEPFNFELPEGEAVDLTVVAPLVEPSPGTIIIQGPPGEGGSGSVPDATAVVKGILRLAGDLGGTALSPTVPGLAGKAALVHTHAEADVTGLTAALAAKADAAATTAALAGKAALAHTHAEADVTGLTAALAGKAPTAHTHAEADVTGLTAALAAKAPLASPTFTGNPTAPTPSTADSDTSVATTAHVHAAIAADVPAASESTAGRVELATAAETTTGTDSTRAVHPAGLKVELDKKAPLASPAFTGNPTAPTPTAGDNDTSIATTAFVTAAVAAVGGGGLTTGDVQFTVARVGASTTLSASEWNTYPLDGTPSVNIGGGSWNNTTFVFTVPENGLYLCLGAIRSAESIASRSLALAIGTTNADGAHVLWGSFGGTNADQSRTGRQYTRLARFNAGDLVRMYIYSDGLTYATQHDIPTTSSVGQFMSLVKLAD